MTGQLMQRCNSRTILAFVLIACLPASLPAKGHSDRPCGPAGLKGPLVYLIPQGFFGADFKPACRRHDRCYGTPGSAKPNCDGRFFAELQGACRDSRRPLMCKCVAKLMYLSLSTEAAVQAFTRGQVKATQGVHH